MQTTPGLEKRKLFALNNKEKLNNSLNLKTKKKVKKKRENGTETDSGFGYTDKETNQTRPYVCESFQSAKVI